MTQYNFTPISEPQILTELEQVCRAKSEYFSTPLTNLKTLRQFFGQIGVSSANELRYIRTSYPAGQTIVDQGIFSLQPFHDDSDFNYASVPLGFIISGEVVVTKGGKATKTLSEGDFIGLFETSDWILTDKRRHIGDWTLKAASPVEILFFGKKALTNQHSPTERLRKYLVELARQDHVPQPITTMPLLDWVASHTTASRLADYAIIAHTHLLPNNLPFFRHLAYLVGFGEIFVMEKPYSTVKSAYEQLIRSGFELIPVHMEPGMPYEYASQKSAAILWSKVIEEQGRSNFKKLLIIDDGGDLWLSLPWHSLKGVTIAGVEQTQRGITRIEQSRVKIPPIVSVASSGTKKLVESQFIGHSVVKKLVHQGVVTPTTRVSILGMGSIGQAVYQKLQHHQISPHWYDAQSEPSAEKLPGACSSIDALLNQSDIVIGTTGTDALKGIAFERVSGTKTLVSASSADVEFSSVLKLANPTTEPFSTRRVSMHEHLNLEILNGGYPYNFDREKDATPSEDIVLTRALMYAAAMQAVAAIEHGPAQGQVYALDRQVQEKMLERWIHDKQASNQKPPITTADIDRVVHSSPLQTSEQQPSVWQE